MKQSPVSTPPVSSISSRPQKDGLSWDIDNPEDVEDHQDPFDLPTFRAPLFWYRIFRRFRKGRTSALNEWMAYYQGRYSSKLPDSSLFKILLARNGCWDIPCPFVPGSRQASEFCQDGLFMADIHFLMDRWISHVIERGFLFFQSPPQDKLSGKDADNPYLNASASLPETVSSPFPLWVSNYSPIHYQQAMQVRAEDLNDLHASIEGSRCLVALFLDKPSQWAWLIDRLHADNRALLSTIVYESAPVPQRDRLVSSWVNNGWMTKSSSQKMVDALSKNLPPVMTDNTTDNKQE